MYRRGTLCADQAGRRYRSKIERDRSEELQLLLRAGEIRSLVFQPRVTLYAGITFRPDFSYWVPASLTPPLWRLLYEDTKADIRIGAEAQKMRMIQRLWVTDGPAPLRIMRRGGRSFTIALELLPHVAPWLRREESWPDPPEPAPRTNRRKGKR